MTTLVVGAGERRVEGAIHHDVQELDGIDIVCEFYDLPGHVAQLPEKITRIEMTHVLEHFPIGETQKVLTHLRNILEDDGELYLEVPNFQWQAAMIMSFPSDRQIVEYAFGGQRNQWDFHYNGFTPAILIEDLQDAGFTILSLAPSTSISCLARKIP